MNTPDTTCTPTDIARIADAAQDRRDYLTWLIQCLQAPRWYAMSEGGQSMIRDEAVLALRQLAGE